jgi:uncharacterized protein (TIGR02145 family)
MKTFTLTCAILLLSSFGLFAQSGMTIQSGGQVTVNGNLIITPVPFVCGTPMTDTRDGKTYTTVLIGTQCWFAQNLNVGTRINGLDEQTNNSIVEKYCYNDLESNCTVYGGLYQWNEMMQYVTPEGAKGICPTGWHLPTDDEWTILTTYLGGSNVAGGKMKEIGTSHWTSPNTGATNSSGFSALPGGNCVLGGFNDFPSSAYFWTSTWSPAGMAYVLYLSYGNEQIQMGLNSREVGYSTRCVKD